MKDEFIGEIISEFVGSKSKMYFLVCVDCKENKKPKGVDKKILLKTQVIKNMLMFCLIKNW